jgi:hypothetical protein
VLAADWPARGWESDAEEDEDGFDPYWGVLPDAAINRAALAAEAPFLARGPTLALLQPCSWHAALPCPAPGARPRASPAGACRGARLRPACHAAWPPAAPAPRAPATARPAVAARRKRAIGRRR